MAPGGVALVLAAGIVLAIAGIGAWAWQDAGRSPVRDIVVPVKVPELPQ